MIYSSIPWTTTTTDVVEKSNDNHIDHCFNLVICLVFFIYRVQQRYIYFYEVSFSNIWSSFNICSPFPEGNPINFRFSAANTVVNKRIATDFSKLEYFSRNVFQNKKNVLTVIFLLNGSVVASITVARFCSLKIMDQLLWSEYIMVYYPTYNFTFLAFQVQNFTF